MWDSRIFDDRFDEHDGVIFKVIVKIDISYPVVLQLRLKNGLFEVEFELQNSLVKLFVSGNELRFRHVIFLYSQFFDLGLQVRNF